MCTPNYPYPFIRYRPCMNNPYWREWLKFIVRQIALLGYDGVFVDNNVMSCYCDICQKKFVEYLSSKYTFNLFSRLKRKDARLNLALRLSRTGVLC